MGPARSSSSGSADRSGLGQMEEGIILPPINPNDRQASTAAFSGRRSSSQDSDVNTYGVVGRGDAQLRNPVVSHLPISASLVAQTRPFEPDTREKNAQRKDSRVSILPEITVEKPLLEDNPYLLSFSGGTNTIEPERKLYFAMILAIAVDIAVNAYIDFYTTSTAVFILQFFLEVLSLLFTFSTFCFIARRTVFLQLFMYKQFFLEFRPLVIVSLVNFCLFFTVKIYYLVMETQGYSRLDIWSTPFFVLYVTQKIVTAIYYVTLLLSGQHAMDDKFKADEFWR